MRAAATFSPHCFGLSFAIPSFTFLFATIHTIIMTLTLRNCPLALSSLTPIALALWALSAGVSAQTAQAAPPDAGQVLRDLQPAPVLQAPQAALLPRRDSTPAPAGADEAKVLVRSVVITGNQVLTTAELQALVANLSGTEQTLSELNAAARRVTAYYRDRGYSVARAYLPAQDITSGAVTISVIEGRMSSQRLDNQSRLSSDRAQALLSQVKVGEIIQAAQIDRSLLLLQDTPGVGASRSTLLPGASVGTSELLVELDAAPAYAATATLDNNGSRYTGVYRIGASFNLASPLQIGDQLNFAGLTSGAGLRYGRLAYQLPLGSNGLRAGVAYLDTRYQLGSDFSALAAHGSANSTSVFAAFPFVRSPLTNLSGTATVERKQLNDRVDSTSTVTDKSVNVASLGLAGNRQDAWGGGSLSSFELNVALGSLSINTPSSLAINAVSSQSNGRYGRLAYGASRTQRLSDATTLLVSLTGQQASKNLDSSEKFSLGGASGVRAYPQGEGSGDAGNRLTLELQQSLLAKLQATLFYDAGHVTINKNPFGTPAANSRSLAGAGVGLNASFSVAQLRSALAWRTTGGAPVSVPASTAKGPTLWLNAGVAF